MCNIQSVDELINTPTVHVKTENACRSLKTFLWAKQEYSEYRRCHITADQTPLT